VFARKPQPALSRRFEQQFQVAVCPRNQTKTPLYQRVKGMFAYNPFSLSRIIATFVAAFFEETTNNTDKTRPRLRGSGELN
jgi:hypothetical protein